MATSGKQHVKRTHLEFQTHGELHFLEGKLWTRRLYLGQHFLVPYGNNNAHKHELSYV